MQIIHKNKMISIFKFIILFISIFLLLCKKNINNFLLSEPPLVSIIIPVYNNLNFTTNCITSILEAEPTTNYEIIISNDNSEDKTKSLKRKYFNNFSNIFIQNNQENINYLLNCNNIVKKSRGKYILFLNNDSKVHKDWLTSLIKLIESDEKIGMVGSKFIYPNGLLQEAGGIIWRNGDLANYGNGDNAELPEYNYIKEVDFISGTSILIRKSLWEKIGGFDKRFIPAYYEDIDLAFELRKLGFKIMYQPLSIVEHYKGISFQKFETSMIQQYQETNKKKFIEKWENELKYQLEPGNFFMARDRCQNKSRIFVLDRFVPNFDKDAGGRCCYMYLNIFKDIGFQVTFLGDDLRRIEPYTTILQQKGIEVLYGDSYKNKSLENWFKDNLNNFKYVYLQRPDISEKYIDLILKYFSGKIIYFAHDLHHVRLAREYNITHDKIKYKESQNMKKIEMEIFSKVDIIYVVGNYEYSYLKEKIENKIIRNIPLYIYESQYNNIEKNFQNRRDLIFVGGFLHSPNVDGVLWFSKKIYPKILEKFPDMVWHIVSSDTPQEIRNLESKNIKIDGFLSDEELHLLYQKCRLAIAPLRFGAGVKGKILEAAHNQIPMVTTSIGGEGLDNSIGAFIVEDNAEKMAKIICKLYVDYSKLKQMSDSGKILIEKYFSVKKTKEIIMKDIN